MSGPVSVQVPKFNFLSPGRCDLGVPIENGRLQLDITKYEDKARLGVDVKLGQIVLSRTDSEPIVIEHNLYLGVIGPLKRLILGKPVDELTLMPHPENFGVWGVQGDGLQVKEPMLLESFMDMVATGALQKMNTGKYEFEL
jgi:hypothetical protein